MRLGEHTIGVRQTAPKVDGSGNPVVDEFGDQLYAVVDVEVPGCLVAPTGRMSDTTEPEDRAAPGTVQRWVAVPPGAAIDEGALIVWPITGRSTVDGQLRLAGREWQVIGEPEVWDELLEVQMRASS